jgi:hypothetical protein
MQKMLCNIFFLLRIVWCFGGLWLLLSPRENENVHLVKQVEWQMERDMDKITQLFTNVQRVLP